MNEQRVTDERLQEVCEWAIGAMLDTATSGDAEKAADDVRRAFDELRDLRAQQHFPVRFILYRPDLTWEETADGDMIPVDGQDVTDQLYKDRTFRAGDTVWRDDDGTLFAWRLKDDNA